MGKVFVIGLAGGIGSGKSTVARELARLGAEVLDADRMVHALLRQRPVAARIARRFGRGALDAQGRVDRKALGAIAFRSKASIRALERLLHPAVIAATKKRIAALRRAKGVRVVVIDAPLLFEVKMDRLCDEVVFVDAPKRARAARLKATRGWTAAEMNARERKQQPIEVKRRKTDVVIANGASRRTGLAQVRRYWKRVQEALAPDRSASKSKRKR